MLKRGAFSMDTPSHENSLCLSEHQHRRHSQCSLAGRAWSRSQGARNPFIGSGRCYGAGVQTGGSSVAPDRPHAFESSCAGPFAAARTLRHRSRRQLDRRRRCSRRLEMGGPERGAAPRFCRRGSRVVSFARDLRSVLAAHRLRHRVRHFDHPALAPSGRHGRPPH